MQLCTIHWFDMTTLPDPKIAIQILVFDTRINLYRCVSVREDGLWQEECGKVYDPKYATFYARRSPMLLREKVDGKLPNWVEVINGR